jgi:hypothetical protein
VLAYPSRYTRLLPCVPLTPCLAGIRKPLTIPDLPVRIRVRCCVHAEGGRGAPPHRRRSGWSRAASRHIRGGGTPGAAGAPAAGVLSAAGVVFAAGAAVAV